MGLFSKLSTTVAASVVALGLTFSAPAANAGVIQLGFIMDSSGSIGSSNWNTIKGALANAVNTLVPTTGAYEISVVNFSSTAVTTVNHVLIDSVAARTSVANAINAMNFLNSTTNMAAAFNAMGTALGGSMQMIDHSYVNLATDGVPYGGSNPTGAAITARDALITGGVDNISIEAIGGGVDPAFLQNQICYPGPCTVAPTYAFPGNGFYIPVANAAAYASAIDNKLQVVTQQQVPEPGMALIVALGVVGIAAARRKAA
ncbi:MAG: hypothetical protein ACI9JL_000176 [Paracoccaceae bacterium]|jgi:hypothetical protein